MTTRKLQPAHEAQPQISQRRQQPDAEQHGVQRAAADSVLLQSADARQLRRIAATRPAQLRPVARQLQRTYGNRHVVGLLRLARDEDAEEAVQRAVADEDAEEAVQRAVAEEDEEAVQRVNDEGDERLQRAPVGPAGGPVAPAVERAIAGARGGGQALDSGVRAQMEGAFAVNFGDVRVHTGHSADQLNRQLSARAFTTGSDIFFRQGAYRPGDASGRELLAHELTHVVQQGGGVRAKLIVGPAGDAYEREADDVARAVVRRERVGVQRQVEGEEEEQGVVRRETQRVQEIVPVRWRLQMQKISSSSLIQCSKQQRQSLQTHWYIEMEPPSSLIPVGTKASFRLKNADNWHLAVWEKEGADRGPIITLDKKDGQSHKWVPRYTRYPVTFTHTFNLPGHYRISFDGRPIQLAGPSNQPMAMTITGSPIAVAVELDVVHHLTRVETGAFTIKATYKDDISALENPNASGPEIAQAFQRVAIRYGIEIINRNKQEATDLLSLYTTGTSGRTAIQATEEIQRLVKFDAQLVNQIFKIRQIPSVALRLAQQAGIQVRNRKDLQDFIDTKIEEIQLVRAALINAFPAMAIGLKAGSIGEFIRRGNSQQAQAAIRIGLHRVLQNCDEVRKALATGDLHIFDVQRVVNEIRETLGINSDPRKRRAIDAAIAEYRRAGLKQSLAMAAASIMLLFVPGVGPYLAIAMGVAGAAISWEKADDLQAAAGAGVKEGIVSHGEALAAAFWAGLDTLLAGLDVVLAMRPLTHIIPHAPKAVGRMTPRLATRSGRIVAPTMTSTMEAGSRELRISADELTEIAQRLLKRPVRSLKDQAHIYSSWEGYVKEYNRLRNNYSKTGRGDWPDSPPSGGYYDPIAGELHVGPHGNLLTALHETIHKVADETFPMGRQLLGDFLDEGITEAITRARLGPHAFLHGYDPHVAFVLLLQRRVGNEIVENAVQHGNYRALREAVRRAFGGSEAQTFEFFALLRRIGSDVKGGVGDPAALSRAIDMLGGMSKQGKVVNPLQAPALLHDASSINQLPRGSPATFEALKRFQSVTDDQLRNMLKTERNAPFELMRRYRLKSMDELKALAHKGDETARIIRQEKNLHLSRARAGSRVYPQEQEVFNRLEERLLARRARVPKTSKTGTMAVSETDLPISKQTVEGASPKAGGTPDSSYKPPSPHPRAQGHAEQNILGATRSQIKSAGLDKHPELLKDRTLWILVDQEVCQTCRSGLMEFITLEGKASGVLKQFSMEFKELTIVVTDWSTGNIWRIRNGVPVP